MVVVDYNQRLFVENTAVTMSELLIRHFFNAAMRRVELCGQKETPAIAGRRSGKTIYIDFASAEMASKALNLDGIPLLGKVLKVRRPDGYNGPRTESKTWQDLTGVPLPEEMTVDPEQDRMSREIFIGNTTPDMNETNLRQHLGAAMLETGLATMPGNPINSCRVSGKFAFVEFRTAQEAKNSLNLDNIPFMGSVLKVGRPAKYAGPPDIHSTWEDILAKYIAGDLNTPNSFNSSSQENIKSRIIELRDMLHKETDLENPAEYRFVLDDTQKVCSEFGKLVSVRIPKHGEPGETKIFLEYATVDDAYKAFDALQRRSFDGHRLKMALYDESKFYNGILD